MIICLFQDGRILNDGESFKHNEYCIRATLNGETNTIDWKLAVCFVMPIEPSAKTFFITPLCK